MNLRTFLISFVCHFKKTSIWCSGHSQLKGVSGDSGHWKQWKLKTETGKLKSFKTCEIATVIVRCVRVCPSPNGPRINTVLIQRDYITPSHPHIPHKPSGTRAHTVFLSVRFRCAFSVAGSETLICCEYGVT